MEHVFSVTCSDPEFENFETDEVDEIIQRWMEQPWLVLNVKMKILATKDEVLTLRKGETVYEADSVIT